MSESVIRKTEARTGLNVIPYIVLVAVYLPTLYDLVLDWARDPNYSHGFVVPFVSLYLFWTVRREARDLTVRRSMLGLGVVLLGLILFILGTAAAEYFTARLSFVVTLFGLTWYLYGDDLIKRTWFAFFFLCFMIPIPYVVYYAISFPLQLAATKITVGVLNFIGLGVIQQGNIIHLEGGYSLEVAEACSGMRSLVSLLALGTLYAYWSQEKTIAKVILFLCTIPIAIFANVVRVLVTSLLAASVTDKVAEDPIHTIMGLSVFVVAFICLFVVGQILRRLFK
jgi:exosortase